MTRGQVGVALVIGLGTAPGPLDTAVNIAFPDITGAFDLSLPDIQWVVVCYVLTYAGLMLGFGRLGDIFGHRRIFAIGLVWSAVSLLLCAVAPSYGWFLLFRVAQGVGAALTLSCGPALITLGFAEAQRGRMIAAYTMMFGLASAVGPLIGGVLVQHWGWPAVFWFRIPIVAAGLLLLHRIPATPAPSERQRFDLVGAALLAWTLGTLILALNRGDQAIWLLALALTGLFGFIWRERRAPAPIIDLSLFRRFGFVLVNLSNVLVQMAGFVVWLLVPYYLIQVLQMSAGLGGLVLAMSPLAMVAGSYAGGRTMARLPTARVAAAGAVSMAVGLLAAAAWSRDTAMAILVLSLLAHGFGQGLFQVATLDIVVETAPRAQRGVAGSLGMVARTVGIVIGATGGFVLFDIIEQRSLAGGGQPMTAFLDGFQVTFAGAAVIAACCGLLLWRLRRNV